MAEVAEIFFYPDRGLITCIPSGFVLKEGAVDVCDLEAVSAEPCPRRGAFIGCETESKKLISLAAAIRCLMNSSTAESSNRQWRPSVCLKYDTNYLNYSVAVSSLNCLGRCSCARCLCCIVAAAVAVDAAAVDADVDDDADVAAADVADAVAGAAGVVASLLLDAAVMMCFC